MFSEEFHQSLPRTDEVLVSVGPGLHDTPSSWMDVLLVGGTFSKYEDMNFPSCCWEPPEALCVEAELLRDEGGRGPRLPHTEAGVWAEVPVWAACWLVLSGRN